MGDKGGGRGWVNLEISLLLIYFLLTSLQSVTRFSLQPLFSGLNISTYLIEAGHNIVLFNVRGPSFFGGRLS